MPAPLNAPERVKATTDGISENGVEWGDGETIEFDCEFDSRVPWLGWFRGYDAGLKRAKGNHMGRNWAI
jgi:hypothetical protein